MRVLVVGGRGAAGSRIVTELRGRGHEVTVASRGAQGAGEANSLRLDATDVDAVAEAAGRADVMVGATRPPASRALDVEAVTSSLAEGSARAGRRLLVVGGAAPLRVAGTGRAALDDPAFVQSHIRPFAVASVRQLEVLREAGRRTDWVCLAPAADFAPGEVRGRYRSHLGDAGGADLVVTSDGISRISMEDFALAVADEVEGPRGSRCVIAVGW